MLCRKHGFQTLDEAEVKQCAHEMSVAQASTAGCPQKLFELSQAALSQQQRIDALGAELARERANWDSLYRSYTISAHVCSKIAGTRGDDE